MISRLESKNDRLYIQNEINHHALKHLDSSNTNRDQTHYIIRMKKDSNDYLK